ncbi:EAL domain-containing protein [Ruminococcus sp.]|uniref:EAL domain-containing protein n=1 Tax=Ruminococcus sp. TaxID=41978 RepID=UPI0025FD4E97|nr:EAL domain-containing protein [Ruminococcus sp.]MBQ8966709.1 EAL domain-containing protein [Ruminococcus sp.]
MNKKDISALTDLCEKLTKVRSEEELAKVIENFTSAMDGKDVAMLKVALFRLGGRMLVVDAEDKDAIRTRRIACLTDEEKVELKKVEEIIDGNLLKYYFQPIVSAWDGEIFSYEALMRSAADPQITPFHILKYAELSDRLDDIERATFLNVLEIIEREKGRLGGKAVFINSIPNVRLGENDTERISELLEKNSDAAVVELTENAEADDSQLSILKDRYRSMNVRIAVDDYGTGYSNVKNLLRYTPNFVKIDRSLLTEINSDPRKRHFVRDIIEFCHDNGILALAEGVETSLEMKTVILMGIDLIQGFYTARPAPELVTEIPYEIKQEIRRYQIQRMDGKQTHVYSCQGTERVLLEKLKKHGYKCLRVMSSEQDGDITLVGDPSLDTRIYVEVDNGFRGRLTLESAHLSNSKNRPCIIVGDNAVLELAIYGSCRLHKGGIYVPESASVNFTGIGALDIDVDSSDFFAIGGYSAMRHGRLSFGANVEFSIEAKGQTGCCIGSGLGGEIDIHQGVFTLALNGNHCVCIGALSGSTDLDLRNCGISADVTLSRGVVIGSRDGDAELRLHAMSLSTIVGGKETACIGSVDGNARVEMFNSNFVADVRSDKLTVVGSLYKDSDVEMKNLSMNIKAGGVEGYAFGGLKGRTVLELANADTHLELNSKLGGITRAAGEDLHFGDGRYRVTLNGEEYIMNAED